MAFIDTVAPRAATGAVRAMYARQQAHWGYVPIYAKVFSHRPEVLARWARLLAEIRRPLDTRRFELVTFAAAHALRHTGCTLTHGKALSEFIGTEAVLALAEGGQPDGLSPAEREMVAFARKIARDAASIERADIDALRRQGLGDADIFDIAATAAGRAFFTKLLDALGVQADAAAMGLDERFREALSVGRPVEACTSDAIGTEAGA